VLKGGLAQVGVVCPSSGQ